MSEECSHDCSSCGQECGDRSEPQSLLAQSNPDSHVKKVIGVVSGKGGVGKSMVTSLLASASQQCAANNRRSNCIHFHAHTMQIIASQHHQSISYTTKSGTKTTNGIYTYLSFKYGDRKSTRLNSSHTS